MSWGEDRGRITHTTTRTFYWNHEAVQPLVSALVALDADLGDRAPHIDPLVLRAATERLDAVRLAVARLTDPVVDP